MGQSEASRYGPCHHRSSIKGNTMAGLPAIQWLRSGGRYAIRWSDGRNREVNDWKHWRPIGSIESEDLTQNYAPRRKQRHTVLASLHPASCPLGLSNSCRSRENSFIDCTDHEVAGAASRRLFCSEWFRHHSARPQPAPASWWSKAEWWRAGKGV